MGVEWESLVEFDLDLCALTINKDGLVLEVCYYNSLTAFNGAITHSGDKMSQINAAAKETITVNSLATLPAEVNYVVFCLSSVNRIPDRVTYETAKFTLTGPDGAELTPSFLIAEKEGMVMGHNWNHMSLLATCTRSEDQTWAMNVTPVVNGSSGENFMDKTTLKEFLSTVGIDKDQCKAIEKDQPKFEFKNVRTDHIEGEAPLYVDIDARKHDQNAQVTLNWKNLKYDYDLGCIALDNQGQVINIINSVAEDWTNQTGTVIASVTSGQHDRMEFEGLQADLMTMTGAAVRTEDGGAAILENASETISIKFKSLPDTVDALYFTASLYSGPTNDAINNVTDANHGDVFALSEIVIQRFETRFHKPVKKPQYEQDGLSEVHKFPLKFTPGSRSTIAVAMYRNKFCQDKWHLDLPARMGKGLVTSQQVEACQELHATFRNKGQLPQSWSPKQTPVPKSIKITLKSATGIRPMDLNGKADPYVIVQHDNNDGKKQQLFKTKVHKKTLEPVWDETFEIDPKQVGKLLLTVMDKDLIGSDEQVGTIRWILPLHQVSAESKTIVLGMSKYRTKDGEMKSSGILTAAIEGVY